VGQADQLPELQGDVGTGYFHARQRGRRWLKRELLWLANELAVNVLSFDYPGYGFSSGGDGSACEEGMVQAAECALEVASQKLKCDVADVITFGKSIGSFPAVSIASRPYYSRLRGLVLLVSFPTESWSSVQKTGDFLKQIQFQYHFRSFLKSVSGGVS
jgi:pimeloyl-ACP methyl ester carboxylesterase